MEVYRCRKADGVVSFQQFPCKGQRLEVEEAQTSWSHLRKSEKRLYRAYRKKEHRAAKGRRRGSTSHHHSTQSATCYNKRHALEETEARLRAGYAAGQGDKLRRQRDYLEGYLARFCK